MAETYQATADFIDRWQGVTRPEGANYQLFPTELTSTPPTPELALTDHPINPAATTRCR